MWQLTVSLQVLFGSLRIVQSRRLGLLRKDLTYYALSASLITVFAVGVVYASINSSDLDHARALEQWPYLILGGILFALANLLALKLLRYVIASIAIFMAVTNTLSTLFFANIIAAETLTLQQWLGVLVLIIAVIVVAVIIKKTTKEKGKSTVVSLLLVLGTSLLIGPAIVNEKYLIDSMGLETYVVYGWGLQALSSIVVALVVSRGKLGIRRNSIHVHMNVWLYALLLGVAGFFFVTSIDSSGSASLVSASSTATVAVTIVLSYFILKERTYLLAKLAGMLISFVGLALLFT